MILSVIFSFLLKIIEGTYYPSDSFLKNILTESDIECDGEQNGHRFSAHTEQEKSVREIDEEYDGEEVSIEQSDYEEELMPSYISAMLLPKLKHSSKKRKTHLRWCLTFHFR